MPNVNETMVRAFAHCGNPRCAGNNQEPVDAVEVVTGFTIRDLGGDQNTAFSEIVERSMTTYRFLNDGLETDGTPSEDMPNDKPCPVCGRDRELTGQARPTYDNTSGFDQMGLLGGKPFDPGMVIPPGEDKIAALQAQVDKLARALEAKQEKTE